MLLNYKLKKINLDGGAKKYNDQNNLVRLVSFENIWETEDDDLFLFIGQNANCKDNTKIRNSEYINLELPIIVELRNIITLFKSINNSIKGNKISTKNDLENYINKNKVIVNNKFTYLFRKLNNFKKILEEMLKKREYKKDNSNNLSENPINFEDINFLDASNNNLINNEDKCKFSEIKIGNDNFKIKNDQLIKIKMSELDFKQYRKDLREYVGNFNPVEQKLTKIKLDKLFKLQKKIGTLNYYGIKYNVFNATPYCDDNII